jgi:protoporphyrinogen oxidase
MLDDVEIKTDIAKKVAVIGGGPMGLVCAYSLIKKGYTVDVFEKSGKVGGMSAHFDFSGLSIEEYYHFVCGPDEYTFNLLKELNLFEELKWTETKMGFYYNGELYKWGGPFELLKFPKANIIEKIRYGLHIFLASKRKNWHKLDSITALDWIYKWEGKGGYTKFWDSLFQLKFYELKNKIASPWLWSRLARVAKSRKNIFTERTGYIRGGSEVLLKKLCSQIEAGGGRILLNTPVENITSDLSVNNIKYDAVVSTVPLQYLNSMYKFSGSEAQILSKLDNIGVVCVVIKLKEKFTDDFWLYITDQRFDIPGIIETSNLDVELKEHIVYIPFYLHHKNPKYNEDDCVFKEKSEKYLRIINPDVEVKEMRVFRYQYAQPVATLNFKNALPKMASTERPGFYFADTAFSYPEDRSINDSIKIAEELALKVINCD